MKGISPLVAVIMLIAFTLIVAGILAGWATQFAQTQRRSVEFCVDARVLLQRGTFVQTGTDTFGEPVGDLTLVVYNYGRVDLDISTLLTYKDLNRHPAGLEKGPAFNITAGDIQAITVNNVGDDLEEVSVQSEKCPGTQDFLRDVDITGIL